MSVRVRRASPADAAAIAAIAEESFGEAFDRERIRRLLQSGRNYTLLALDAQGIRAFADNFITVSVTGERRLELDLLAVQAKARGMGIGRRLIAESILLARTLDATLLRSLVKSENQVMRGLCGSCEFAPSQESYGLYVASPALGSSVPLDATGSHLVPVETLAYKGIWIEGALTRDAIGWAQSVASPRQLATVGALAAQSDHAAAELLTDNGFRLLGVYDWWTLMLKNG